MSNDKEFWTDALVLEYAVKSHIPKYELTIEDFKKSKELSNKVDYEIISFSRKRNPSEAEWIFK